MPRGVWFAVALAIVVVAIAAFQATGSSSSRTASGRHVDVLDPSLSDPTDTDNPLLRNGSTLVGQPAPDVSITRFDGSPVTLEDYAGTPLVVNFWAETCTPCRTEMPAFQQVHEQFGDQVAFLGVDSGEGLDAGRPFAQDTGVSYDLASDPQARLIGSFQASLLPTTVLIRSDGTIARVRSGAVSAEQLQSWIQQDLLS